MLAKVVARRGCAAGERDPADDVVVQRAAGAADRVKVIAPLRRLLLGHRIGAGREVTEEVFTVGPRQGGQGECSADRRETRQRDLNARDQRLAVVVGAIVRGGLIHIHNAADAGRLEVAGVKGQGIGRYAARNRCDARRGRGIAVCPVRARVLGRPGVARRQPKCERKGGIDRHIGEGVRAASIRRRVPRRATLGIQRHLHARDTGLAATVLLAIAVQVGPGQVADGDALLAEVVTGGRGVRWQGNPTDHIVTQGAAGASERVEVIQPLRWLLFGHGIDPRGQPGEGVVTTGVRVGRQKHGRSADSHSRQGDEHAGNRRLADVVGSVILGEGVDIDEPTNRAVQRYGCAGRRTRRRWRVRRGISRCRRVGG